LRQNADLHSAHQRSWRIIETELKRRHFHPNQSEWLDVGCGTGALLSLAGPLFRSAIGCDPSTKLPFPAASFDFVTATCCYYRLPLWDRQILSAEIFRVLRPGGIACFIDHNPLNLVTRKVVSPFSHWQMISMARSVGLQKPVAQFFVCLPEKIHSYLPELERLLKHIPFGARYAVFCERPNRAQLVKTGRRAALGLGRGIAVAC
jgi:ubiquinone/menaquinone biosynthesis C-methylase UbiE